jgi:hypothetical protein
MLLQDVQLCVEQRAKSNSLRFNAYQSPLQNENNSLLRQEKFINSDWQLLTAGIKFL